MKPSREVASLVLLAFLVSSCVTPPMHTGPSMPAFMGDGKTPAEFGADDQACRATALSLVGTTPAKAAQDSQVVSAIAGVLLGAALGAAAGSLGREPALGAGVGAAAGLASGTAWGASAAGASAAVVQSAFDSEYFACMYARGHKVPVAGSLAQTSVMAPTPPAASLPPPPPAAWRTPSAPASAAQPPAVSGECVPTGKYVKTPAGFVQECM